MKNLRNGKTALVASLIVAWLAPAAMAATYYPDRTRMADVQRRAHRIDELANYTSEIAERYRHHDTRREDIAIQRLGVLAQASDAFHNQIERNRQRPQQTDRAFDQLVSAYIQAARALPGLHGYAQVRRGFYELQQNMDVLMNLYRGGRYYESRYGAIIRHDRARPWVEDRGGRYDRDDRYNRDNRDRDHDSDHDWDNDHGDHDDDHGD